MSDVDRPDYWVGRWRDGRTGWHEAGGNRLLRQYWDSLGLEPDGRVLVPLAGATSDIWWLAEKGYRVCAVDVSPIAAERLFDQAACTPERSPVSGGELWRHGPVDYWVADLFALTPSLVGRLDAAYDRAALVAFTRTGRRRYSDHLMSLLRSEAGQLLITFEYPEGAVAGPPFSVPRSEVERLYGGRYVVDHLGHRTRDGSPLVEHVYRLRRPGTDPPALPRK